MGRRLTQMAAIGVCAILSLSALSFSTPAVAETPSQTSLAAVRAQLDDLEKQQQEIATQQAASQEKLQAAQNQLAATQAQIATQQAQNSQLQSQLAQIALQQYQNRGLDTTALLMTSNSVDTMLNQIVVMQQVTETANSLITALQLNQGTLIELQRSQEANLATIEQEQAKLKNLNKDLQSKVSQTSSLFSRMTAAVAAAAAAAAASDDPSGGGSGGGGSSSGSSSGSGGGGGNGVADPQKMVPNPSASLICPMKSYTLSSPFGMRVDPITHLYSLHDGLDMAAPGGTKIYAPGNGYVVDYYWAGGYGNRLVLDNGIINGRHIVTTYNHLSGKIATPGTLVAQGDPIATVGSTGWSTGYHLHYQIWIDGQMVNPAPYV